MLRDSPARLQLLSMIDDYQELEAEYKNSPARAPGEVLLGRMRKMLHRFGRGTPADSMRFLMGWTLMETLMDYKSAIDMRFGSGVSAGGDLFVRGVRCTCIGMGDDLSLIRVLPNKWVRLDEEERS